MAPLDVLSIDLWASFLERVQEVIRAGLEQLAADAAACGFDEWCENDLNRELFFRVIPILADVDSLGIPNRFGA